MNSVEGCHCDPAVTGEAISDSWCWILDAGYQMHIQMKNILFLAHKEFNFVHQY